MASPHDSRRRYAKGTNKTMYWDHTYEDVMNLIARVPEAASVDPARPATPLAPHQHAHFVFAAQSR